MRSEVEPDTTVARRPFPSWSIRLPASFSHVFVHEGGYWHAWDKHRSVSLSSIELVDERGPVAADRIVDELTAPQGSPLAARPPGLPGWAVEDEAPQPAVATRCLSGMLAVDGRMLIVTIASDDREWTTRTWCSIRQHRTAPPRSRVVA
jgi:hypothetical protein